MNLARNFSQHNRIVVHYEDSHEMIFASSVNDTNVLVKKTIRHAQKLYPDKKISYKMIDESEIMRTVSTLQGLKAVSTVKDKDMPEISFNNLYEISQIDKDTPTITFLNSLILEAYSKKASDIHIENSSSGVIIRFRIFGILSNYHTLDSESGKKISNRIKVMSNLNTLERRKPQDGRFTITISSIQVDVRVSTVPSLNGESIVMRFLDSSQSLIELGRLGFDTNIKALLEEIPTFTDGLILITGPTGCGKTTTLASLLSRCNPQEKKIISIEDPIEYVIDGVTQIQTNDAIELSFSSILKRILRQDPDIIMIGEIRDKETAELAIRAALTGHLVLSTLHTRSADETSKRLIDTGIPEYLLHAVLKAVIGQRLPRKICNTCQGMNTSCLNCNGTGWSGRIPLAEYGGKITLQESANRLVSNGLTTSEEIFRVSGIRTSSWRLT